MKSLFGTVSLSIIAMFNMLFGTETEKQVNQEPNQGVILVNKNVEANKPQEVKFEINDQNTKTDDQKELTEEEKAQLALEQARKELITGVKLQDEKKTSYKKEDKVGFVFDYEVKKEMFKDQAPATDTFKYEMKVPDIFDFKDFDAKKAVEVELFEKDSDNEDTKQEEASNEDDEEGQKTKKVIALLSYNETKRILTLEIAADKVNNEELAKGQFALSFNFAKDVKEGTKFNISFFDNNKIKPISIEVEKTEIIIEEDGDKKDPVEEENNNNNNNNNDNNNNNGEKDKKEEVKKEEEKKEKIDAKAGATPNPGVIDPEKDPDDPSNQFTKVKDPYNLEEWFDGKAKGCLNADGSDYVACNFGDLGKDPITGNQIVVDFIKDMTITPSNTVDNSNPNEIKYSDSMNITIDFEIPYAAQIAKWNNPNPDPLAGENYVFKPQMYLKKELPAEIYVDGKNTPFNVMINDGSPNPKKAGTFYVTKESVVENGVTVTKKYITLYFDQPAIDLFYREGESEESISGFLTYTAGIDKKVITEPGLRPIKIPGEEDTEGAEIYIRPDTDALIQKKVTPYSTHLKDEKHNQNVDRLKWEVLVNPAKVEMFYPFTVTDIIPSDSAKHKLDETKYKIYEVEMNADGTYKTDSKTEIDPAKYTIEKADNDWVFTFDKVGNDNQENLLKDRQTFLIELDSKIEEDNSVDKTYNFKNSARLDYKILNPGLGGKYKEADETVNTNVNVRLLRDTFKQFSDITDTTDGKKRIARYNIYVNRGENLIDAYNYLDTLTIKSDKKVNFEYKINGIEFGHLTNSNGTFVKNGEIPLSKITELMEITKGDNSLKLDINFPTYDGDGNITKGDLSTLFVNGNNNYYITNSEGVIFSNQTVKIQYDIIIDSKDIDEDLQIVNELENKGNENYKHKINSTSKGSMIIKTASSDGKAGSNPTINQSPNYVDNTFGWMLELNRYGYHVGKYPIVKDLLPEELKFVDDSQNVVIPFLKVGGNTYRNVFMCDTKNLTAADTEGKLKECITKSQYLNAWFANPQVHIILGGYTLNKTAEGFEVNFDFGATTKAENDADAEKNKIDSSSSESDQTIYSPQLDLYTVGYSKMNGNGIEFNPNSTTPVETNINALLREESIEIYFRTKYDASLMKKVAAGDKKGWLETINKAEYYYYKNNNYDTNKKDQQNQYLNTHAANNGFKQGKHAEYEQPTKDGALGYFTWDVYYDYNNYKIINSPTEHATLTDSIDGFHKVDMDKLTFGSYKLEGWGAVVNNKDGLTLQEIIDALNAYEESKGTHNKIEDVSELYTITYTGKDNATYTSITEAMKVPNEITKTNITLDIGRIIDSAWYKDQNTTFSFNKMHMNFTSEIADGMYRQKTIIIQQI